MKLSFGTYGDDALKEMNKGCCWMDGWIDTGWMDGWIDRFAAGLATNKLIKVLYFIKEWDY